MAGASIPLTPAVHQMIDIGPVPMFEHTTKEVGFPIVRDVDTNMYERQHGTGFEIGSYAHRAILMDADDIPSIEASALSPTMLPFTQEDFDPQLEDALELFLEIVGDETVGVKLAINGLLSLTPDGNPIIGETPEVKASSAAAIWIKEAPGIAKAIAEWMTNGEPEIDPHGSDIARFYDHHKTAQHIAARTTEGYNKTYGIVHPQEQWASNRPIKRSPAYERQVALGAEFFEAAGWERPFWYEANRPLLEEFGEAVMPARPNGTRAGGHRSSTPSISRCATGPAWWTSRRSRSSTSRGPAPAGTSSGSASIGSTSRRADRLHAAAQRGRRDPRRPHRDAPRPRPVPGRHRRRHGDATKSCSLTPCRRTAPPSSTTRPTSGRTFGLWGPRARDVLSSVTSDDVSHQAFPFLTSKAVDIDGVRTLASRISYVGELGWEIYVPIEQGLRVWDALWEAGRPHGLVPVGIGTYAVTSRPEKGYRAHGAELELD